MTVNCYINMTTNENTKFIVKMATTGVGFRWLDILEKEFDKACVELDTSLVELETEEPEVVFSARQKITTLSSCFAQLTHKALTIFQSSAKLEAELVDMRAELVQARAAGGCQESGDAAGNVPDAARSRAEAAQLARENVALRETVLALHSELFGARLATKYLDKELAGRIQQLQLLGSDMRAELRDSLWAQVEAEILLQRHKTLVRVCRGLAPRAPRPPQPARAPPVPRTVRVRRSPHLGLGISVTGGREHGVPILISELEAGGPAALTGELYVGDAILAINDHDLTQACHKEAVQALQSVKGDCALCVQFIATDDDDRLSEDNYRFPLYPEDGDAYEEEPDASGATPTAPRTPDYNHHASGSECGDVDPYGVRGEVGEYDNRGDNGVYGARGEGGTYGVRSQEGTYGLRNEIGAYGAYHVRGEGEYIRNEGVEVAGSHYADYNNVNNLSILDMDDDSIKIEARLEMAPISAVSGSSTSPRSTPVHSRTSLKKKRKPQDWRTKGAYCAVSDAQSSDDLHEKSNTPNLRPDPSNLRPDPSNLRSDPSNQRPDLTNQRSDPSNQRPDASNQRPDPSNQRSDPSNQRPDPSNQRPDPSNQRPDPSNLRPDPSNQRPDPSNQRSDLSNQRPELSNHQPDLPNHQANLSNHQPDQFNHRPDLSNHWPDSLNHRTELVNHRSEPDSIVTPTQDVCLPPISEYLPKPSSTQDDSRAITTSTTAVTNIATCNMTVSTPGATFDAASALTTAVTSKPTPAPDLRSSREKAPAIDVHYATNTTNGDNRPRKETKSFRIGSARRVMDSARNGEVGRHPSHPPPAPRLLPGRGDPDFGTPV